MKKAFTLIELLIVVAIIAILAAIAVPNFLEAQMRSKIARSMADMRTVSVGIESYAVDNSEVPWGLSRMINMGPPGVKGHPIVSEVNLYALSKLTTPIAYITTIPLDPFTNITGTLGSNPNNDKGHTFIYQSHSYSEAYMSGGLKAQNITWSLHSIGPSMYNRGSITHLLLGINWNTKAVPYDPTNGTKSYGWIVRTNKGIFKTLN